VAARFFSLTQNISVETVTDTLKCVDASHKNLHKNRLTDKNNNVAKP